MRAAGQRLVAQRASGTVRRQLRSGKQLDPYLVLRVRERYGNAPQPSTAVGTLSGMGCKLGC